MKKISFRKLTQPLLLALAPHLILWVTRLLTLSCRTVSIQGAEHIQQLITVKQPFLPCYWHQQMLFCVDYLLKLKRQQKLKLGFLASPSRDGDIGAKVFASLGVRVLRGSANKTGAQALRDVYLVISKEKLSIGTTPDGSRGPAFKFKQGWLMLSQLSGAPIVPMAYAAERAWHVNSWDQTFIPKPFTKIAVVVGEPIYVAKKTETTQLSAMQAEMEGLLNKLAVDAQNALHC